MNRVVIVSCGAKKAPGLQSASRKYVGSYFKVALRWARRHAFENRIFICSAKFGLLKLNQTVPDYNLKMGDPGSVEVAKLKRQRKDLKLPSNPLVVGGGKYLEVLRKVFPKLEAPFAGAKLGFQMKKMNSAPRV